MNITKKILVTFLIVITCIASYNAYAYYDDLQEANAMNVEIGDWVQSVGISSPQEFFNMATSSTSSTDDYYHLQNDIDFSGFTWDYTSSMNSNVFRGTLDGQGYSLDNITMTSTDTASVHMSLFSQMEGATIKNVKVSNYTMGFDSTYFNATALESSLFASNVISGDNFIENITMEDVYIVANSIDGAGGLVASLRAGANLTIKNIKATNVHVLNTSKRAGGLVSRAFNGSGSLTVEDIEFQGTIASDNNTSNTGGIIGTMQDLPLIVNRAVIEYNATGTINLSDGPMTFTSKRYTGGFIGNNNNDHASGNSISNAFYTGELYTDTVRMGTAVGREKSTTTTLTEVYYSNVKFNTNYNEPSNTQGLNSTVVNAQSMPDLTWWNNFATNFHSANSLWTQDVDGRLTLIR